jgi:putative endonuclease
MNWPAACSAVTVMTEARQSLGKIGENLACGELERRGYAILARRYRRRGGEIDIVARDGATLVFIEVKARDGRDFGDGAEAVTIRKRQRIVTTAMDYVMRNVGQECACRFDVVVVDLTSGEPRVDVIPNAFDASGA